MSNVSNADSPEASAAPESAPIAAGNLPRPEELRQVKPETQVEEQAPFPAIPEGACEMEIVCTLRTREGVMETFSSKMDVGSYKKRPLFFKESVSNLVVRTGADFVTRLNLWYDEVNPKPKRTRDRFQTSAPAQEIVDIPPMPDVDSPDIDLNDPELQAALHPTVVPRPPNVPAE